MFELSQNQPRSLFVETAVTRAVAPHETVQLPSGERVEFHRLFARIAVKSGHHIGAGTLWVSDRHILGNVQSMRLAAVHQLTIDALAGRAADDSAVTA